MRSLQASERVKNVQSSASGSLRNAAASGGCTPPSSTTGAHQGSVAFAGACSRRRTRWSRPEKQAVINSPFTRARRTEYKKPENETHLDDVPDSESVTHDRSKAKVGQRGIAAVRSRDGRVTELGVTRVLEQLRNPRRDPRADFGAGESRLRSIRVVLVRRRGQDGTPRAHRG